MNEKQQLHKNDIHGYYLKEKCYVLNETGSMGRSKSQKEIYNCNEQHRKQLNRKNNIIGGINTNDNKLSKNGMKMQGELGKVSNLRRATSYGDEYQIVGLKKTKSNVGVVGQDFSLQDVYVDLNMKSKGQESTEIHSLANCMQSVSKYKQRQQFSSLNLLKGDDKDMSGSLYLRIKSLEGQIKEIEKERQNQKNKLLEYFMVMDRLKYENKCLKGGYRGRGWEEGNEQQRESILKQLSEVLVKYENDKMIWESVTEEMRVEMEKREEMIHEIKEENRLMRERMDEVLGENCRLEGRVRVVEEELRGKNVYVQEMDMKLQGLREALQNMRENGDERMKRIQESMQPSENEMIRQLQQLLQESEAKILHAQCEYEECRKQLQMVRGEREEMKTELEGMRGEMDGYRERMSGLWRRVEQKQGQINRVRQQIRCMYSSVNREQNLLVKQKQLLNEQKLVLCAEVEKCRDVIKGLKIQLETNMVKHNKQSLVLLSQNEQMSVKLMGLSSIKQQNQNLKSQMDGLHKQIALLQGQISMKKCQQNNIESVNERKCSQTINSVSTSSLSIPSSLSSYSKLEIKLCSILNIYLTSNIDKIVSPIQKLLENVRKWESNSDSYEQLLNVFELKENPGRLLFDMKICKNNYLRIIDMNRILQSELAKVKYDVNYLAQSNEQAIQQIRRLEPMIQDYNTKVMRLSCRNLNSKYNLNGLKRV